MGNGWSTERRERQRQAIQRWKPWERSTGPRSTDGKLVSSRNACPLPERAALRAEVIEVQALTREARAHCRRFRGR